MKQLSQFNVPAIRSTLNNQDADNGLPKTIVAETRTPDRKSLQLFYDFYINDMTEAEWVINEANRLFPNLNPNEIIEIVKKAIAPEESDIRQKLKRAGQGLLTMAKVDFGDENPVAVAMASREATSHLPAGEMAEAEIRFKQLYMPNHVWPSMGGGALSKKENNVDLVKLGDSLNLPVRTLLAEISAIYANAKWLEMHQGTMRDGACVYVLDVEPDRVEFYIQLGFVDLEVKDRRGRLKYNDYPNYLNRMQNEDKEVARSQRQIRLTYPSIPGLLHKLATIAAQYDYTIQTSIATAA